MCHWKTEGTSYTSCGHYIQTKWVQKIDCNSRFCVNSDLHPPNCKTCYNCEQHLYPDEETITGYRDEWCHLCEPWYGETARLNRERAQRGGR